ncbi:MAG: hypothetical protein JNK02_06585 [Planctomycetes bacterium]|nr:hypothetical protein [Planctomycetota bacterium]
MNLQVNPGTNAVLLLSVVTTLVGVISTVFWMVVSWRAMRAHERIADRIDEKLR